MTQTVETLKNEQKEWSVQDINNLLGLSVSGATNPESITSQVSSEEDPAKDSKPEKRNPLAKNPLAKLTLIALTCGCGALFLALLLSGWNSLRLNSAKVTAQNKSSPDKTEERETNPLLQRNAQLTGELALSQQKQQMRAIREKLDAQQGKGEIPKPELTARSGKTPKTPSSKVSPPQTTVAVSPPSVIQSVPPRTGSTRFASSPPSVPPRARSSPTPPHLGTRNPQNGKPQDPLTQWQQLARLGSYRTVQRQQPEPDSSQTALKPGTIPETTREQTQPSPLTPSGNPSEIVRSGQVIKGQLKTPIVWSQAVKGQESSEEESFLVYLSQALKNAQGQEILPVGTEVMFGVKGVAENGLVMTRAIAVIRDGIEYPLPGNSLKLRSQNGSPLIAQRRNDSQEEMAQADTATFLLGALGKVGELTNRATSSTTSSGIGGFTQSQTYSKTNYVGGLLEGGLNPVNKQWQQRNEQRYQQLQNQPRLWWLEPLSEVQIFVTHSFSIGGNHAEN